MVAIRAPKAFALAAITLLPFIIEAAPAIPHGKCIDDKSETRTKATDFLLEPSIPNKDGIDEISDAMKEEGSISREEIEASNINYFPWGPYYPQKKQHHIPDDDDDSEESEKTPDDKVKRGWAEDGRGLPNDSPTIDWIDPIDPEILDMIETTTGNEPRYNRMEHFSHRPTLHELEKHEG
ncbi:hypothetical protein ACLX1H_007538 [Fusarium chlamydosporum]